MKLLFTNTRMGMIMLQIGHCVKWANFNNVSLKRFPNHRMDWIRKYATWLANNNHTSRVVGNG
jgi:hypothetical protein